jgi:glucose-1-phosphate cytidylyltransferase
MPKPLARIGNRPVLWYLMKYYAHYGHTDFLLCLGYRGDAIKEFFLNYDECLSNDFVMHKGATNIRVGGSSDIHDWRITFVDTGQNACVGERLKAVEEYLQDEPEFMANYSDGLSDLPLDQYLDFFRGQDKIASFVTVRPTGTFHVIEKGSDHAITEIRHVHKTVRINGGFFIFKNGIFDHLNEGEELVMEPFHRLIEKQQLIGYDYDGFWKCIDTLRDKQQFDEMFERSETPWVVW